MKRGRIYLTLLCSLLFIGLAQGQYKGCSSNERKNFSLESPKTWSNEVWKKSEKIYHKIIEHPFIQELANGSLDIEKFKCYLAQDEIYLGNYGRQMFKLVDMIEDSISKEMFRTFAKEGLEGEKSMHSLLIDRFKIDTAVNASYVTIAYNAHSQKAIESGSKEVAMSALLPCMWIYNEVGLYILD
ncbi:MAG TPA: hypothetical protein DDY68_01655, partial [Porphyromonadaceae bacterium]|nr:hypothetical protein [Porphyromonadaceae bacterium]